MAQRTEAAQADQESAQGHQPFQGLGRRFQRRIRWRFGPSTSRSTAMRTAADASAMRVRTGQGWVTARRDPTASPTSVRRQNLARVVAARDAEASDLQSELDEVI